MHNEESLDRLKTWREPKQTQNIVPRRSTKASAWENGPNVILHHFVYRPVGANKCYALYMQWHIFERPYLDQFKQFFETVFFC